MIKKYIIAFILVLLQGNIAFLHLPILVVIWANSYVLAFVIGLLADLLLGNRLGVLAITYLLVTLFVSLLKTRFQFNWLWFILFAVASQLIFFYARGIFK